MTSTPTIPGLRDGTSYAFFKDPTRARQHCCDHVLTAPEYAAWRRIRPALDRIVGEDHGSRWRIARSVLTGEAPGPEICEIYRSTAERAVLDARATGWWWRERGRGAPVRHAIGLSGVLVIANDQHVISSLVPGFGSVTGVREGQLARQADSAAPLPRESSNAQHGMRRRRRSLELAERPIDERLEAKREPEHFIFRTAVAAVRRLHFAQYIRSGPRAAPADDIHAAARDPERWWALVARSACEESHVP